MADCSIPAFRHGRVLLCANLIALFRVDRGWSEQNVLPLLTWRRDILGAMAAWSGFLWSARLYGPLLAAIKEDFLLTAQHYKGLGQFASQYAALLTFAALESSELFKTRELAFATSQLPPDGLMRCVASLSETRDGSAEKRAEYWRHRIAPYFQGVWPKSVEVMTSPVASSLARLCMKAGEAFPEAISELSPWLSKAASGGDVRLHQFQATGLARRFPESSLVFWDVVLTAAFIALPDPLKSCLEQIVATEPKLRGDPRFERLSRRARELGG